MSEEQYFWLICALKKGMCSSFRDMRNSALSFFFLWYLMVREEAGHFRLLYLIYKEHLASLYSYFSFQVISLTKFNNLLIFNLLQYLWRCRIRADCYIIIYGSLVLLYLSALLLRHLEIMLIHLTTALYCDFSLLCLTNMTINPFSEMLLSDLHFLMEELWPAIFVFRLTTHNLLVLKCHFVNGLAYSCVCIVKSHIINLYYPWIL